MSPESVCVCALSCLNRSVCLCIFNQYACAVNCTDAVDWLLICRDVRIRGKKAGFGFELLLVDHNSTEKCLDNNSQLDLNSRCPDSHIKVCSGRHRRSLFSVCELCFIGDFLNRPTVNPVIFFCLLSLKHRRSLMSASSTWTGLHCTPGVTYKNHAVLITRLSGQNILINPQPNFHDPGCNTLRDMNCPGVLV